MINYIMICIYLGILRNKIINIKQIIKIFYLERLFDKNEFNEKNNLSK